MRRLPAHAIDTKHQYQTGIAGAMTRKEATTLFGDLRLLILSLPETSMLKHHALHFGQSFVFTIIAATAFYWVTPKTNAADSPPAEIKSFSSLDFNQDGYVDKKEAVASPLLIKHFASADTDKDGRLSPTEYARAFSLKPAGAIN